MTSHDETTKHLVDAVSLMTVAGTLIDMLPAIAALFSIVWSAIRIWETDTVKGWTGRRDQGE
jgi:hypothetical protein